jgi:hypothetical protein
MINDGIELIGKSTWQEGDSPPLQYQKGAFFDKYTFFEIKGMEIPCDGSF